jgi:hypothetical protein
MGKVQTPNEPEFKFNLTCAILNTIMFTAVVSKESAKLESNFPSSYL